MTYMQRLRALQVAFASCGLLATMAFSGCPQPIQPPVPGPTPVADAALDVPAFHDLFTGQIYDCTLVDTTSAQPYAATCGDSSNVAECMVGQVSVGINAGLLACAARDAEMAAFVVVAKGVASDAIKHRAATLRAWFYAEHMTLRSAP